MGCMGKCKCTNVKANAAQLQCLGSPEYPVGLWRLSESVLPVTTLRHDTLPMVLSKIAALLHMVSALIVYTSLMSKMQNA